ncbi:hypothetical protein U6G28_11425 [Actinomycetaceae bacterium MB13-C1-2]|nr:hypothetical protein U6G28_11425 [Actinomycetaceae bacterium MB13-C1-2]
MMIERSSKLSRLRAELAEIEQAIVDSPMSSPEFLRAQEIVKTNEGSSPAELSELLESQGLPTSEQLGFTIMKYGVGFSRLNRKRTKLESRIAELS